MCACVLGESWDYADEMREKIDQREREHSTAHREVGRCRESTHTHTQSTAGVIICVLCSAVPLRVMSDL